MISGRGYGYRRSARGRGRAGRGGRGTATRKWVRPQNGPSEPMESSTLQAEAPVSPKRGPVLKGPRRHAWKRPVPVTASVPDDHTSDGTATTSTHTVDRIKEVTTEPISESSKMKRKDEPKLASCGTLSTIVHAAQENPRPYSSFEKSSSQPKHDFVPPAMKKRGRNKLILADNSKGGTLAPRASRHGGGPDDSIPPKLISSTSHPQGSMAAVLPLRAQHTQSSRGRQSRRGGLSSSAEAPAKRIRLDSSKDETDEHRNTGPSGTSDQQEPRLDGATKLTEFAYRITTSVVSSRGRGRGRGGRGRGRTNMGLVRLEPDAESTPICQTFARGIVCQDEKCTKRHDVPKEAAMPVCSFFQRQGQCLRGDECPFRHVKINQSALDCPRFALLGFCDDRECVMNHPKHVSTNKTITRGGGTKRKADNRDSGNRA